MKKRLLTAVLLMAVIIIQISPLSASAVSNPIVHFSFEQLQGTTILNERNSSQSFALSYATQTQGFLGNAVSFGVGGGITSAGTIGKMLNGKNGITLEVYIKNGTSDSGNLLTIDSKGKSGGIKMTKKGSVISLSSAISNQETWIDAFYDTQKSFNEWTQIALSIDFTRKMSRFYVDGVHLLTVPMAFVANVFSYSGSNLSDKIGDSGLCLDEVRIHPTTIHCSEPMTIYKLDKGYSQNEAYNDVLKDSLIAHFPFEEGTGSTVYSDGGFMKVIGQAQKPLDWVDGVVGTAVKFHPEEKNWINIGTHITQALQGASGLTVSGWYFLNNIPGSGCQNRAVSLNIPQGGALFHLVFRDTGEIAVSMRSSESGAMVGLNFINVKNATELAKNKFEQWHHVTVTADLKGKTIRLFLDGEEMIPTNAAASNEALFSDDCFTLTKTITEAVIGANHMVGAYTQNFNGAMDELKFYNRAVTYNEARYIYHENKNGSAISRDSDNYAVLNTLDMLTLAVNCNEVFSNQSRLRINWNKADAVPVLKNGTLFVPAEVIDFLPDTNVSVNLSSKTADVNGMIFTAQKKTYTKNGKQNTISWAPYIENNIFYLPLRAVSELLGHTVSYHNSGVAVVGEASAVARVSNDDSYAVWLHKALTEVSYTKPTADHYATRKEIYRSENPDKIYPSSPALVKLKDGTLVAAHDTIGHGTTVYRSKDNGTTWQKVRKPNADNDNDTIDDTIEEIVYANLFTVDDTKTGKEILYMMGVRRGTGEAAAIAVYKSLDGGLTWSTPNDNTTGWIVEDDGTSTVMPAHTAPVPVVKKNGKIYRAFDISGTGWKNFEVVLMWADETADLLRRDSWTISNKVKLSDYTSKFPAGMNYADPGMCEANAVLGPDGTIMVVARFNSAPSIDRAAVLKLNSQNQLTFDRVISFPGGMSKFVIRYDESIKKYVALSNPNIQKDYPNQRLCLALMVSEDLYTWKQVETLLVPNWLENLEIMTQKYAFQYPDFIIDGNDILYVVREANIGANSYHNANCITFYRLENYKQYIPVN